MLYIVGCVHVYQIKYPDLLKSILFFEQVEHKFISNTRQFLNASIYAHLRNMHGWESNPIPCEFKSDSLPLRHLQVQEHYLMLLFCAGIADMSPSGGKIRQA